MATFGTIALGAACLVAWETILHDRSLTNDEINSGDGRVSSSSPLPTETMVAASLTSGNSLTRKIEDTSLANIRDVSPLNLTDGISRGKMDVPVFWVIPKAGTSTIKSVMAKCLDLAMASSNPKVVENPEAVQNLEVMDIAAGRFINVDLAVPSGIAHAQKLGLVGSGLSDVAMSSYIHEMAGLFEHPDAPKGKMFAVFRHPVERMVSDFYYMQKATWERSQPDDPAALAQSLEEYATDPSKHVDNWMTRLLADRRFSAECAKQGCPLTEEDYQFARSVLTRKCLVLLLDKIDESLRRLLKYTGWSERLKNSACLDTFAHKAPSNKNDHNYLESGTELYEKLREINRYDILLYWHARELFENQGRLFDSAVG